LNIVYVDHYAGGPKYGMEFRPYYLAREWVRAGHRVAMLAASFSHVRSVQPTPPDGRASHAWKEDIDGIEYVWFRTPRYSGNNAGRVWNITVFLARVAASASRVVRDFAPDVVIASSTYPMDIWVARRIARKAAARLVFEVHDLWPLSPVELGDMSPRHPFVKLCALAERTAYRTADTIVSMLPNVSGHVASFGVPLSRLHIVPNGVSPGDWEAAPETLRPDVAGFIAEQRAAGRLVVCYAGAHGLPNALDVLIDAAALLADAPLAFALVGDGLEKGRLAQKLAGTPNERVRMFAPLPKAQVPTLLASIDIAYLGLRKSPLFRFGIAPNKLLDYMMAGCAVLQAIEAGNDPVTEAGCGLTVQAGSPAAVAEGLRRLAALPASERRDMGRRGRDFVLANHTYPVLAQRFVAACAGS
jgi:glycosyltransferase involved in cell wall biosynthesis